MWRGNVVRGKLLYIFLTSELYEYININTNKQTNNQVADLETLTKGCNVDTNP